MKSVIFLMCLEVLAGFRAASAVPGRTAALIDGKVLSPDGQSIALPDAPAPMAPLSEIQPLPLPRVRRPEYRSDRAGLRPESAQAWADPTLRSRLPGAGLTHAAAREQGCPGSANLAEVSSL